ncbi:MAG TPA: AAA family ATPase [Saprospiraceae bacterium]|nr:AAA family ATPase [Saprospiraceae bacterium]
MLKKIYVAATSQHVGKTTCTLGLVAAIQQSGINVGYCKPVGQKFIDLGDLQVDKDALLFSKVMGFELDAALHSPVILGAGATTAFLDNPAAFNYEERIFHASSRLSRHHDVVVYEGTGHPGVGSVVNLSNADVASLVGAKVVMIVEGGIGSTLDELNMCTALFREKNVPVIGVIVNKTIPEKLEKIEYYVGKKLKEMGIPLLGVMPFDKSLSNPIMETINRAVNGYVIANFDRMDNMVEDYLAGSLIDNDDTELSGDSNLVLVVSMKRLPKAVRKVKDYAEQKGLEESPLSGIIITGDGRHEFSIDIDPLCGDYIRQHKIPVVSTALDTLGSMIKINRIEVKINTRTPWKAYKAIEMIKNHVNLKAILDAATAV